MHFKKHIFFCTNQKISGKKCCQDADANSMRNYAKQVLQECSLHSKGQFRVNTAGCLGRCSVGPNILIYPEGVWYTYSSKEDVDEIIERHLLNDEIVERLLIDKSD